MSSLPQQLLIAVTLLMIWMGMLPFRSLVLQYILTQHSGNILDIIRAGNGEAAVAFQESFLEANINE